MRVCVCVGVGVSASIHDIVNKNSYIVFEKFICVTFISGTQSTCTSVLGEVSTLDTMVCIGAIHIHTQTYIYISIYGICIYLPLLGSTYPCGMLALTMN